MASYQNRPKIAARPVPQDLVLLPRRLRAPVVDSASSSSVPLMVVHDLDRALKTSTDVFRYPPELLPLAKPRPNYNGEQVPVYRSRRRAKRAAWS